MRIEYDGAKRQAILDERGLNLAKAGQFFDAFHLSLPDVAHSTDEDRTISVGMLDDEVVIVVWTDRNTVRRIITMWKANDKERQAYRRQRERSG